MKDAHAFQDDPLGFLDRALPLAGDSVWLPHRQLCLTEASASRSVLANDDGLYDDHSDFFHTRRGPFGPRRLQVRIRRATLALLTRHHSAQEKSLPALVEDAQRGERPRGGHERWSPAIPFTIAVSCSAPRPWRCGPACRSPAVRMAARLPRISRAV